MAPEFAACRSRGDDAGGPDGIGGLEESRELLLGRDLVLLGPREVREETLDLEARVLHAAGERRSVLRRPHADPMHPGVDLHVDGHRPARGRRESLEARRRSTAWA